MPVDACLYFYECKECGLWMKPKQGNCCVCCSYGDAPCPPVQEGAGCCKGRTANVLIIWLTFRTVIL
ncbi:MAG: GDCCVxC domain-containing (seleno)protein [Rhodomicrobium sp.]